MPVELWQKCLSYLQEEFPSQQYNTWIRPLRAEAGAQTQLRLLAPNRFVMDWVSDKYLHRIKELLSEIGDDVVSEVVLEVGATTRHRPGSRSAAVSHTLSRRPSRSARPSPAMPFADPAVASEAPPSFSADIGAVAADLEPISQQTMPQQSIPQQSMLSTINASTIDG